MPQVIIDSLETVPESLHELFKKTNDGKFECDAIKSSDVAGLKNKTSELLGELKSAKEKLSAFSGIDDPQAAITAMEKLKGLDQKKLVDSGKLDELKAQLTKELADKLSEKDGELGKLSDALTKEMIGGRFSRSAFIAEKLVIPADIVEATFGRHFQIDEGRVVAVDDSGKVITSEKNFGEPAGFDEALGKIIDAYPHKDHILKSSVKSGTGTTPGGGGGGGKDSITRSQFDALSPAEQLTFAKGDGNITD